MMNQARTPDPDWPDPAIKPAIKPAKKADEKSR